MPTSVPWPQNAPEDGLPNPVQVPALVCSVSLLGQAGLSAMQRVKTQREEAAKQEVQLFGSPDAVQ